MQELYSETITSLILNGTVEIEEESGLEITYSFTDFNEGQYYLEVRAENSANDHFIDDDMFVHDVRLLNDKGENLLFAEFYKPSWNRITTQQVVDITEQLNHLRLSSEQKRLYALTNKN